MATAAEMNTPQYRIHLASPDSNKYRERIDQYIGNNFKDEVPRAGTDIYACTVDVAPGVTLKGAAWGNHLFISGPHTMWHIWAQGSKTIEVDKPFFTARIVGSAYTKQITTTQRVPTGRYGSWNDVNVTDIHHYTVGGAYSDDGEKVPYAYLNIEVSAQGATPVTGEFFFNQPSTGVAKLSDDPSSGEVTISSEFFGLKRTWTEHITPHRTTHKRSQYYGGYETYDVDNHPLEVLREHLTSSQIQEDADEWWRRFLNAVAFPAKKDLDTRSLASVLKRKNIAPVIEELKVKYPSYWRFLAWLFDGQTKDKLKNNSLISAMLVEHGTSIDTLLKALREARDKATVVTSSPYRSSRYTRFYGNHQDDYFDFRRAVCLNLPGATEMVEEKEAKADFTKRKTAAGQAEGLGVDKAKYPLLFSYIEAGNFPITVFNNPDKQPVNREFAIWEKALQREGWGEVLTEIARNASGRSTYEKDITPYLNFLFQIEKYLDRHTEGRKKWRAMPKFVSSQWDLEMDEPQDGMTKRRSAFTPVADNETRVVTVPYVAVCVSGVRTQWCYSKHYYVFEEGQIDAESGTVIVNEVEKKLNGRDDYGLMYFTLTGTVTARGYPTFLIIFERLKNKGGTGRREDGIAVPQTRVHFHRVHPKRSTNGIRTMACDLIERCYQYMAGDVPASDVAAQQGDLIFIRHPNDPIAAGAKVEDPQKSSEALVFESHAMVPLQEHASKAELSLYTSTAKTPKNRLGFLHVNVPWRVNHPEHDAIEEMAPGWWEVRRCRSWEANPHAIWSLTID